MGIDNSGLDYIDRKMLSALLEKYNGGPVGLDNIAASISESIDTIEDVCEPYLMQIGFIQRTPRGRMATPLAWQYFGLTPPKEKKKSNSKENDDQESLF